MSRKLIALFAMIVLLGTAVSVYFMGQPSAADRLRNNAPDPSPTHTVAVQKVVYKEVRVEVTSKACKTFMKDSQRLVDLQSKGLSLSGEALYATANENTEELDRINGEFKKLQVKVENAVRAYNDSRLDCQLGN